MVAKKNQFRATRTVCSSSLTETTGKMQVLQRRYWEFAVIENRADGEKVLHEYSDYLLKK